MRSKQAIAHAIDPRHRHRDGFLSLLTDDERRCLTTPTRDMLDALDDRERFELKIAGPAGVLDIPQPTTLGILISGLDATPTGTDAANDVVADFTGGTLVNFDNPSVATPVTHTPSQTLGSTFHPNVEGIWVMIGGFMSATAASTRGGAGFGNVAGDLSIDPAFTSRTLDVKISISAAADTVPVHVETGPQVVTRAMSQDPTLGLFRLLLSNNAGAGATAASLAPLAQAHVKILRMGNIPRALATG
jgi:hypothetical protein